MFRKALIKKRTAAILGAVAVLAVAGIAIAYWTTTGSGSGSGAVASSNGTLALHGTITEELTPGSSSPVSFTADNSRLLEPAGRHRARGRLDRRKPRRSRVPGI